MTPQDAHKCAMIDIDCAEYCHLCKRVLAFVETAQLRKPKEANVTAGLGQDAHIPVFSLAYSVQDGDISRFAVRQLSPRRTDIEDLTPQQWADRLIGLRLEHWKTCAGNPEHTRGDQ
jgi:hypothetical protein